MFDLALRVEHFLTLLTIIVGTLVAYVAYKQFLLANEKFKLDLFEKRFAIYKEVELFLQGNMLNITTKEALDFFYKTKNAVFLFDDDISYYIDEIFRKALKLEQIRIEHPNGPFPKEREELWQWFINQLTAKPSPLIAIFSPYLKFSKWK